MYVNTHLQGLVARKQLSQTHIQTIFHFTTLTHPPRTCKLRVPAKASSERVGVNNGTLVYTAESWSTCYLLLTT